MYKEQEECTKLENRHNPFYSIQLQKDITIIRQLFKKFQKILLESFPPSKSSQQALSFFNMPVANSKEISEDLQKENT